MGNLEESKNIFLAARIIRMLEGRLYLMDAVIKAKCFYRVEIWKLSAWKELERIQGKFVKMTLEIDNNITSYI